MPHSPYRKTVYEPIRNIDEYRNDLSRHRASWEDGERDKYRDEMLLDIGDSLMEQCDFLEGKLGIKVRICPLPGTLPLFVSWTADGGVHSFFVETRTYSICRAEQHIGKRKQSLEGREPGPAR